MASLNSAPKVEPVLYSGSGRLSGPPILVAENRNRKLLGGTPVLYAFCQRSRCNVGDGQESRGWP